MADEDGGTPSPAPAPAAPPASATPPASAAPPAGDWRAGLPPELAGEKSLADFKDVGSLARSYVDTKRLVGADAPGPDAPAELQTAYRRRIGVPDSPDKYDVKLPAPPEGSGLVWEDRWVGALKQRMHAANARPETVQAAVNLFHEYMSDFLVKQKAAEAQLEVQEREQAVQALEKKWGPRGGPQWNHNKGRAEAAIHTLLGEASPEARQRVLEAANDPEVAHAFSLVAEGLLERGFIDGAEIPARMAPAELQQRIDKIRADWLKDPTHPLNNPEHPDHARMWREWEQLNAQQAGPKGWEPVPGFAGRAAGGR